MNSIDEKSKNEIQKSKNEVGASTEIPITVDVEITTTYTDITWKDVRDQLLVTAIIFGLAILTVVFI